MRWFITALACIGLLALVGCGGDSDGSDPNCDPGTHEENGLCVPDENNADTGADTADVVIDVGPPPTPCDNVLDGSHSVKNQNDADALAGYCKISGDLTVASPGLDSIHLPDLAVVGGDLSVRENNVLTSLELPALTTVGGDFGVGGFNSSLKSFSLPALTSVGGDLRMDNNQFLESFSLPKLTTAGGWLNVVGNDALTSIDLPEFTTVGVNLEVRNNNDLISFSLPKLDSVGFGLRVSEGGALTSFSLPKLTTVSGWLNVVDNPILDSFDLHEVASVGLGLEMENNPALAQCLVDALRAQIEAEQSIEISINIVRNNEACTCAEVNGVLEATCP